MREVAPRKLAACTDSAPHRAMWGCVWGGRVHFSTVRLDAMSAPDSDIESYKSTLTEDHYLGVRATQIHTRARGARLPLSRVSRPVAARARRSAHARDARAGGALCFSHSLYSVHTLLAPFSSPSFRPLRTISFPRVYLTSQYAINTVRDRLAAPAAFSGSR